MKLLSASVFERVQIHLKKVIRHIIDDLESTSDDSDEK